MNVYIYLNIQDIKKLHTDITQKVWGNPIILKPGEIEKTLSFVKNDSYYPYFYQKITYLLYSMIMNHPFVDGNKRTALFAAAQFVYLNTNNILLANSFIREYENIVVSIAAWLLSKSDVEIYTENFINSYDTEESPLLKVYKTLQSKWLI